MPDGKGAYLNYNLIYILIIVKDTLTKQFVRVPFNHNQYGSLRKSILLQLTKYYNI